MASLKQNNSEDWVGSNDVLTAYIYKVCDAKATLFVWLNLTLQTIYVGRTDSAPINIHTLLNLRRILPSDFTHPYLHNNLTGVVVPEVPAHQLGAQPLHLTALALRRSLIAFTDNLDTFRSELVWLRQFRGRTPPLLPNLPGGEIALISNWRSARLNKMNWSVAKTRGDGAEAKPTFVFLGMQDGRILPSRGTGQIMSESKEGIWVRLTLAYRICTLTTNYKGRRPVTTVRGSIISCSRSSISSLAPRVSNSLLSNSSCSDGMLFAIATSCHAIRK